MCGIAGFFGPGSRADIERMTAALFHRGPDDGGVFVDGRLHLGHRRLAVLDLAQGAQPMIDEASGAAIVYNGEIYNHLEIRRELEKLGHVFRTSRSDTETLLHAFQEWGPACLPELNGMFAFALYEPRKSLLWLARDRFGEKPLYCSRAAEGFAFASEVGALRLWPGFDPSLDEGNLQRFFAWNYLPGIRSIRKNCSSLEPGSWLRLDLRSLEETRGRYWRYELAPDPSWNDEEELCEELRRLLVQAVARRFLSDVPLGVFLSGGIDSSAILAAACRTRDPETIRAFAIGFREKSFDESAKARQVAAHLGVPLETEFLTEAAMQASIGEILGKMSEPLGDASLVPTARLCAFARKRVVVALSGDGGDELFGGYDPLDAVRPAEFYERFMPGFAHKVLRRVLDFIRSSDRNMSLEFRIRRILRGLSYPASMRLPVWMSGLEPAEIAAFFDHPLTARELYEDAAALYERNAGLDGIEQAMLFFARFYLSDDILAKSDRASMMCSLESRAVFLDNDLAEFCMRLPMRFKYRRGARKYLLKKALAPWLPRNILEQPKKGFGIPLNRWLRHLPAPQADIPGLKPGVLARCHETQKERRGDFRYFLWDVLALQMLAGGLRCRPGSIFCQSSP